MAASLRTVRLGPLFGLVVTLLLIVGYTVKPPVLEDLVQFGRVPPDASMSEQRWYGPAVDDVVGHIGRDGRVASVSVYDRSIAFDVEDDGRTDSWRFDWTSPKHMRAVPSPRVPIGRTFSARLLDRSAPARIMAAARERHGDVSISVLRLEPARDIGAMWTLLGTGDRGGVRLTARPDGRLMTT